MRGQAPNSEKSFVGQLHALGMARGPRGVHLDGDVLRGHRTVRILRALPIAPGFKALPALVAGHHGDDGFDRFQFALNGFHQAIEVRTHEKHFGSAVVYHVGHLRRRQAPVNAHGDGAGLGTAKDQLVKEIGVFIEEGDSGAVATALGEQALGHLAGMAIEGGVVRTPILEEKGRGLRARHRLKAEHLAEGLCLRYRFDAHAVLPPDPR